MRVIFFFFLLSIRIQLYNTLSVRKYICKWNDQNTDGKYNSDTIAANQNKFLPHSFESGFQRVATWISKFPHSFPLRIFSIFVRAKHLNALNCPNNKQIYFTIFKLIDRRAGTFVDGEQGWKTYNSRRRLNKAWQSTDEFHVLQVSQPSGMVCSRCLARKTKLRTGYNRAENFSQQFRSEHNEHIFTLFHLHQVYHQVYRSMPNRI